MDEFIVIFLYNKKHLILVRLLFVFCFLYFQLQYNEVVEMVEAVLSQLVEYQSSLMATTILHDAESQRWSDMRPFYGGFQLLELIITELEVVLKPRIITESGEFYSENNILYRYLYGQK